MPSKSFFLGLLCLSIATSANAQPHHKSTHHRRVRHARGLSDDAQHRLFWDIVVYQDRAHKRGDAAFDASHDQKWLYWENDMDQKAYAVIARRYHISEEQCRRISARGTVNNWPIPPEK